MARTFCAQLLRSRLAMLVLPLVCATLASLAACDKSNDQQERRYCDQTGCFACVGDKCYPVPGDPAKPDPGTTTSCDNDAICGADHVCNLGRCESACKSDASCATGQACISGRCRPNDSAKCGVVGALCVDDKGCGTNQKCVNRACATNCDNTSPCALGQICQTGSCIEDPSPKTPQCVFDADCTGGKARCINAYCLPTCTDNTACKSGATCLKGVCRGSR